MVKRGKTPVLSASEARHLLDSIDTSSVVGMRDRALIATMIYSFARISAVVGIKLADYFPKGRRFWLRLHEKGGKYHEVPCHHTAEEYLDAYIETAGIESQLQLPLFRAAPGRAGRLSERQLDRHSAYAMVRRRARKAGIRTRIGNHTFRATGITAYLDNGGSPEHAQSIAAHESPTTTKLYDRREMRVRPTRLSE